MIYAYDPADVEAIIECLSELQDTENQLEPSRIKGRQIAELHFKEMQNKIKNNSGNIFVSKNENEVSGVVILYIEANEIFETPGKHVLLADIVVKQKYRGKGIGSELMKKVEAFAVENEMNEIRIYTLFNNQVALNLYHKNGYKDFGIALVKKIEETNTNNVIIKKKTENILRVNIRNLYEKEEIPYQLLLLADDSQEAIDKYLIKGELFIAEFNNEFVGTFILQAIDKCSIEIKNIAVKEGLQGKKIGTTMLNFIINNVKQRGFKNLIVGTCDYCAKEIEFYKKSGFSITAVRQNFFIDNYPGPIYENGNQIIDMIVLSMNL